MGEFCQKGGIVDVDFMIHVLNCLTKEYDIVLDGLKNGLTVSGDDALTIEVIKEKLNHCYKKIKNKKEEKRETGKALSANNKGYKERCHKCVKYSHKPGSCKCLEEKKRI